MKRFDAFYARMIADTAKKNRKDQTIDKIYEHISKLIKEGYDGTVMWQHQYPNILLNGEIASYFESKGFTSYFDIKDLSLHISW